MAAALALSACGDDEDSSGAPAAPAGPAPTGPPIKLMVIAQLTAPGEAEPTEAVDAANAAASSINARGGVNGSPIVIEGCDDKSDPNTASACARQAAENGTVAVVGSVSSFGDALNPVLENAGIAHIGMTALSPSDYSSPISFPLAGSGPTLLVGAARALADAGAETVSLAYLDEATGAVAVDFAQLGLAGTGTTLGAQVPVPVGVTDVAPLAAAAARDSDGIILALQPEDSIKFIQTARQSGIDLPFVLPSLEEALLEKLGTAAEDLTVISQYAPYGSDLPGSKQFVADMEQYAPDAKWNDFSMGAWTAVTAVAEMIEQQGLTEITSATVLEGMSAVVDLDLGGVVNDFSTDAPLELPGLNRIFNPYVMFNTVEDAKVVQTDGEWVNPFEAATG